MENKIPMTTQEKAGYILGSITISLGIAFGMYGGAILGTAIEETIKRKDV